MVKKGEKFKVDLLLSKELNAKRICLGFGELDHYVVDPQHEMGQLARSRTKDQKS